MDRCFYCQCIKYVPNTELVAASGEYLYTFYYNSSDITLDAGTYINCRLMLQNYFFKSAVSINLPSQKTVEIYYKFHNYQKEIKRLT